MSWCGRIDGDITVIIIIIVIIIAVDAVVSARSNLSFCVDSINNPIISDLC